jgi:hypothetical protein
MSSKKRISAPAPSQSHDAGFGTASGNPCFRDIDIEREIVARPQRRQPAQLIDPRRAQRGGAADKAVEHHPHHDRAQMPARTREAAQHRALCGLVVEMHRLRIELGGEGKDLLARDVARTESAETAGRKIFEGQRHQGNWHGIGAKQPDCGRYLRQSQPADSHGLCSAGEHRVAGARPELARDDIRR